MVTPETRWSDGCTVSWRLTLGLQRCVGQVASSQQRLPLACEGTTPVCFTDPCKFVHLGSGNENHFLALSLPAAFNPYNGFIVMAEAIPSSNGWFD